MPTRTRMSAEMTIHVTAACRTSAAHDKAFDRSSMNVAWMATATTVIPTAVQNAGSFHVGFRQPRRRFFAAAIASAYGVGGGAPVPWAGPGRSRLQESPVAVHR